MRRLLSIWLVILISLTITKAQDNKKDTTGIRFEQSLKWSEILAKAKQEHKFIFVDCYATWCGPCKWMDANVYPLKEVGDVYNQQFISLRVQMDKTAVDDSLTKARYDRAKMLEDDYHVNAYPTFLFFDPEGNPVHKVSGSLDEKQFIQLSKDAQDPGKQYYAILKSFQPGKLDTAEEKGLAWGLINSDKQLAGKLAADYLSRIPPSQLGDIDNLKMMIAFGDSPLIQQQTINYLDRLPKEKLAQGNNFLMIRQIKDRPEVRALVFKYVLGLTKKDMDKQESRDVMGIYYDDPGIESIVNSYIATLNVNQLLHKQTLDFMAGFISNTASISDKGFAFFYMHPRQIDSLIGKDFAEGCIRHAIRLTYWQPEFEKAKQSGDTPDFKTLNQTIANKFTEAYAKRVIADAKVDWYGYEVNDKKQDSNWPAYTRALIDRSRLLLADGLTIRDLSTDINNTCYNNIFLHSNDTAQLNLAVKWMAEIAQESPGDVDCLDTYACLLYKTGNTEDALKNEFQVLQFCMDHRKLGTYNRMVHTTLAIQLMWKNDRIWEEKEFQ